MLFSLEIIFIDCCIIFLWFQYIIFLKVGFIKGCILLKNKRARLYYIYFCLTWLVSPKMACFYSSQKCHIETTMTCWYYENYHINQQTYGIKLWSSVLYNIVSMKCFYKYQYKRKLWITYIMSSLIFAFLQ